MREQPLLERLTESDRRIVVQAAVRRRYRKGDSVFHAGDQGDSLHLIVKGRVAIQVVTANGDTATLNLLGPGETFGELALVSGGIRSATVMAIEPLETLTLSRTDVNVMRDTNPAVQRFLIEVLANQVARLSGRVMEAHFVSAEQRVVRRLADATRLHRSNRDRHRSHRCRPHATRVREHVGAEHIVIVGSLDC